MIDNEVKIKIESVLMPFLSERAIDLVELRLNRYRTQLTVDVLVDIEGGGISIDQCGQVNRFLNDTLEDNGWIEGDYVVEVSSPGIDRPMKTGQDFRRVIGKPVAVYLKPNDRGLKLEYRGILEAAGAEDLVIDQVPTEPVQSKKQLVSKGKVTIPLDLVNKGTQII